LNTVEKRCSNAYPWVLDLDIKSFFDTIDHSLMMKAVEHYTREKWVLLYIRRWLEIGAMDVNEVVGKRFNGTPQGEVISPLLANIYLHFTFDKRIELKHPYIRFERYCDDIIVHAKSRKQAEFIKDKSSERLTQCKLQLNESKPQTVYCRNHNHLKRLIKFNLISRVHIQAQVLSNKSRVEIIVHQMYEFGS